MSNLKKPTKEKWLTPVVAVGALGLVAATAAVFGEKPKAEESGRAICNEISTAFKNLSPETKEQLYAVILKNGPRCDVMRP